MANYDPRRANKGCTKRTQQDTTHDQHVAVRTHYTIDG